MAQAFSVLVADDPPGFEHNTQRGQERLGGNHVAAIYISIVGSTCDVYDIHRRTACTPHFAERRWNCNQLPQGFEITPAKQSWNRVVSLTWQRSPLHKAPLPRSAW